jgi:tRNA threonylcarbamoyladenosine biosynthesis protein TsaB
MNILAIDTATERCSVALRTNDECIERSVDTPRGHADLILPMIQAVLAEGGVSLVDLDGLAYGRGPGAFTGVRIAIGVIQGLAYGARLLAVGISDLAAVAQQVAKPGERILVCMDARMKEVYCARFECAPETGLVQLVGEERVIAPDQVQAGAATVFAGTGFSAYPVLTALAGTAAHATVLPRASAIALLGQAALHAGQGLPAAQAQPVYLRDQVTFVKPV